jgi:hypothetical protein
VLLDPLLARLLGRHALVGDELGDGALVEVGPVEVLDQLVGRAAVRRERRADDLVEEVRRVVAGDGLASASQPAVYQALDPDERLVDERRRGPRPTGDLAQRSQEGRLLSLPAGAR